MSGWGITKEQFIRDMTDLGWRVCPADYNARYKKSPAYGEFAVNIKAPSFREDEGQLTERIILSVDRTPHVIIRLGAAEVHAWLHNQRLYFHSGDPVDETTMVPKNIPDGYEHAKTLGARSKALKVSSFTGFKSFAPQ